MPRLGDCPSSHALMAPEVVALTAATNGYTKGLARVCSVDGCLRPYRARGWCVTHWLRWRLHGEVGGPEDQRFGQRSTRICAVDGCGRRHFANGYCEKHNMRLYTHGSVADRILPTPAERFWSFVDKSGDCWLWAGHLVRGYGRFWLDGGAVTAQRFALAEHLGQPIPRHLQVDHLCRNPRCVNPAHLEAVTPGENTRRQLRHVTRTHCVNGHPYAGNRGVGRRCKRCHANRAGHRPVTA